MIIPVRKLIERVALDNRIGLLQDGLSRKEPESVPHLPPSGGPKCPARL